ncbi:MAG: NADH-quinone oxidoreductase subunit NuoE [Fibrobacter sp.]|nr:NADH-quinone oxidoreductase subunit NuoE [Fibrobacter sp.]
MSNNESKCSCSCSGTENCVEIELNKLDAVFDKWESQPGALIPVLQETQGIYGYIPAAAITAISERLRIPTSKIFGVITFYSFFSLKPRGKYLIRVCLGTACYVRGAEEVLTALKSQLGIDVGETTDDLVFTLDVGRCFGACGLAPVIMINEDVHQWVKSSDVEKILKSYRNLAQGAKNGSK